MRLAAGVYRCMQERPLAKKTWQRAVHRAMELSFKNLGF